MVTRRLEIDPGRLIDSLPGLVWTALPDGRAEYVGKGWLEYTGLSLDDAFGIGWTAALHPEDAPRVLADWAAIVASGGPGEVIGRLRRRDGEYRWFLFRACPIQENSGEVVRWCGMNFDIDDRLRAEADAREHERRYQDVLDGLPGAVALFDADGRITFSNREMLDYLDETLEQVRARPSAYTYHPDDREEALRRWEAGIRSGKPFQGEARLRRGDGLYRWHRTGVFPLRNDAGAIDLWYGLSTDIDDTKRAQALLAGEKRLLELVALGRPLKDVLEALCREVENLAPGSYCDILLLGLDGKSFHVGAAGGLPQSYWATLEGKRVDASYGPCSLAATIKALVIAAEVATDTRWSSSGLRDLMAAHGLKSCWSMPVLSGAQEVLGVFAIYRHETGGPTAREHELIDRFTKVAGIAIERARAEGALKASEAELRRAHGHLTEAQRLSKTGSFITDLVADERDWSEEMFRIFEFDPATKVTNERVRGVVHPEDLASFDDAVNRALDGGDLDFAFRIITASGSVKHLHEFAHVLEEASGHPVFIGAFHDVTETRAAEEALNRARAELTHVARAATLSALTASIAHEVNQPLAGIVTNASTCLRMLATDAPDLDGARVTAHRTIRDANRASEVIQRLRAIFARRTPASESVDLNDAAREVLALLTSELQDARVALRTPFAEGLPAVCGDRVQLQQVILNLVRNAADALRGVEGRPRKLEVRTVRDESGELTLTVRDEGIGIEPGNLPRLFDAFFSTKSEGMGIGLSISRSIIEAHRGRLWAIPNQGGPGMTFSFSLRSPAPEGDDTRCAPPADPPS